jgi:tetratricopeptide (TPR) repeat protein
VEYLLSQAQFSSVLGEYDEAVRKYEAVIQILSAKMSDKHLKYQYETFYYSACLQYAWNLEFTNNFDKAEEMVRIELSIVNSEVYKNLIDLFPLYSIWRHYLEEELALGIMQVFYINERRIMIKLNVTIASLSNLIRITQLSISNMPGLCVMSGKITLKLKNIINWLLRAIRVALMLLEVMLPFCMEFCQILKKLLSTMKSQSPSIIAIQIIYVILVYF